MDYKSLIHKKVPFYKLFPSIITLLALCMGITAIKYTINSNIEMAVVMILIACFMDCMDGSAARLLKSASDFGAQLDSLSDLVSFGVAPALMVYYWSLHEIGNIGWIITLIYVSCTALRLARYNVESAGFDSSAKHEKIEHNTIQKKNRYFQGIASPPAAVLTLTPVMTTFELMRSYHYDVCFIAVYTVFISLAMVSKVPTLSTKGLKIDQQNIIFVIGIAVMLSIFILLMPWVIIPILTLLYIFSIPCTWLYYGTTIWSNKDDKKTQTPQ